MLFDIRGEHDALDGNHVLVLTTNSVEKAAVDAVLQGRVSATIGTDNYGCSLARVRDQFALHLTGTSGAQEDLSMGRIVKRHLAKAGMPRPTLVLLIGVGWANPTFAKIGDVLIATEIRALNHQRISSVARDRREVQRLSPIGDVTLAIEGMRVVRDGEPPGQLIHGPLGSLEVHFADTTARDEVLHQSPGLIGGEMEAWDFAPELGTIPWIILKGVADFGDSEVVRSFQAAATVDAARLLPDLIGRLDQSGLIPKPRINAATDALLDAMAGSSIRISHRGFEGTLNDHLNNDVGPRLLPRLYRYESDLDPFPSLARYICGALLEIAQNAFRHGRASTVSVEFFETKVVLRDDGRPFDLATLSGERGGAQQIRELVERHGGEGGLTLTSAEGRRGGNVYTLKVNRLSAELRGAKQNCRVHIERNVFGGPAAGLDGLSFNLDCKTVYVDVGRVLMRSRALDIIGAIRALLESGRRVYVGCHDQDDVAVYRAGLKAVAGPSLRIFVASRV